MDVDKNVGSHPPAGFDFSLVLNFVLFLIVSFW